MEQNSHPEIPLAPDHDVLIDKLDSLKSDVGALAELTRSEIQDAFEQLTRKQLAATESQSSVLRTLTEAIFTSSAASSGSSEELESLLRQFEDRITSTILAAVENSAGSLNAQPQKSAENKTPPAKNTASGNRSWDEIRKDFLSDSTELQDTNDSPLQSVNSTDAAVPVRVTALSPLAAAEPESPLDIPDPVNIDQLTETELRSTLIQRDQLISTLISRMRRQSYSLTDQITTEQLRQLASEMPDELSNRVQHTLTRIDEQLRLGELEMSLERARIAREITQLRLTRQQIEQAAHQLGWIVNSDGTMDRTTAFVNKSSSSRRWLGKLGLSD